MSAPELQWMSIPLENGAGATFWPEFVGTLLCYIRLMISVFVYLSSCNECLFHLKVGLAPDFNPNLPLCPNCPMYLQEGQPYTFITQLVGQASFQFLSLLYLNFSHLCFCFCTGKNCYPTSKLIIRCIRKLMGAQENSEVGKGDEIFWHLKHPQLKSLKRLSKAHYV